MVQERVYWNEDDKKILLDRVFDLRLQFPEENLTILVNMAQEKLPKEKRRNIISAKGMCQWLVDDLTQKLLDFRAGKGRIHVQTTEVPRLVSIEDQPLEILVAELVKKFVKKLDGIEKRVGNVQSNIDTIYKQMNVQDNKKKREEKAPKKTVTVIGLIPDQVNHLQEKYGGRIDLRYLTTNSNTTQVPKKTDYIVLMTKFMNHGWQDFVFNKYDRKNVYFCDGGMTKLYIQMDTILSRIKQEYT